jgi:hypothetical protein
MPDVYRDRLNACDRLESGETALLKTAAKIREEEPGEDADVSADVQSERRITPADRLVPRDKRPTHRLPLGFLPFGLPFISKKVDTIDWAKGEIERTNDELAEMRGVLKEEVASMTKSSRFPKVQGEQTYPPLNSAFILFNSPIAAHVAALLLAHHERYRMAKKYVDVAPEDVVWDNLGLDPRDTQVRTMISYALTAVLASSSACRPVPYDLIHIPSDYPLGTPGCIHRHLV